MSDEKILPPYMEDAIKRQRDFLAYKEKMIRERGFLLLGICLLFVLYIVNFVMLVIVISDVSDFMKKQVNFNQSVVDFLESKFEPSSNGQTTKTI